MGNLRSLQDLALRSARWFPQSFALASCLGPSGLRVALYHHVCDVPCSLVNRLGITTSTENFERHIEFYCRNYDVVDLDTVLSGKLPKRPLLITFDDGYRSVLEVAGPILASRSLPAVLFLNTGAVGSSRLLLDNLLSHLLDIRSLGEIETAISGESAVCDSLADLLTRRIIPRLDYTRRVGLVDELAGVFSIDQGQLLTQRKIYLQPPQIAQLQGLGFELANHTRDHVHCRILDEASAGEQIAQSSVRIEAWTGRPVRAFSCPYGGVTDLTAVVTRAALASGHRALFLVHSRSNPRQPKGPFWYRVSLEDEDTQDLFCKLEVLSRLRHIVLSTMPGRHLMNHESHV